MTLRIARVLGRANVGGPARTAIALARRLAAAGVVTRLFVGPSGPREGDLLEGVSDLDIVRVAELQRRASPVDLRGTARLARLFREFAPDVVHTHAAKAGFLGRRAALRLAPRPKLVHTFHGHVLDGYFPRPVAAVLAAVERRLARRTDRLVAVSERIAADLAVRHRIAPREKFTVIENGIDLAPFAGAGAPDAAARRAARRALGLPDDVARVVLVPARLVPVKGHALLFRALARLPASLLPLHVVLLGDGPLRGRLEGAARALPDGVVVAFAGFRDDLPRVLPAGDLAVLASRNEGMPLALLDAMAAGVPVVATAVGGVPDLVEDGATGLLAAPNDPESLAACMARVLGDRPLAQRLADGAHARVVARHGLHRVIDEHLRLYRALTR